MQPFSKAYAVALVGDTFFSRIARFELVTGTTRIGRTNANDQHRSAAVAVLIAVMGTRGCTISATLAESEEQLQKSFSSVGASHAAELELLLWMVSRRDATGYIDAIGDASGGT